MKYLIISLVFILAFSLYAKAQSDTLVIHFKSNQTEKIAIVQIQKIQFENLTGVEDNSNSTEYLLAKGNYPNPFSESTNIEFETVEPGIVDIFIFDNKGNYVQQLVCQNCNAGLNTINWNCIDSNGNLMPAGVYYYEVHFGSTIQSRKMLIIK